MEKRGLRVNAAKTDVKVCSKIDESITVVDRHGTRLSQTRSFKYLGSTVETNGECEREIEMRVKAAWKKWRELSPFLCDRKMATKLTESPDL